MKKINEAVGHGELLSIESDLRTIYKQLEGVKEAAIYRPGIKACADRISKYANNI